MDQLLYFLATSDTDTAQRAQVALTNAAAAQGPQSAFRIHVETSVPRALARLRARGADVLVLDGRQAPSRSPEGPNPVSTLLQELFATTAAGNLIGRDQTWVIVDPDPSGVELAFAAGRARVAGTLAVASSPDAWRTIWEHVERSALRRNAGKIALCLAGGGIEGLLYEVGVLRALQDFLPDFRLDQVDILCGISAGSMLMAFLANGLTPSEVVEGIAYGSPRLDRIRRRDLFDPNFGELGVRLASFSRSVAQGKTSLVKGAFRIPPSGVFAGNRLRSYLARQLTRPGMVDDFRQLRRTLLIGATDQDTAEHVVFGSEGMDHIPIHRAVRASAALAPFYAPEVIEGRYFVDGSFSRTTNMRVAAQRGATLVLLIDPLVPSRAETAGHVAQRGGVYSAVQGLKSLVHSRLNKAYGTLQEMYPHVAFHLFQPDGDLLRVMSGSPMKFFYRAEIEALAYRETVRELRGWRHELLLRDFARHQVRFVDPAGRIDSWDDETIATMSGDLRVVA